MNAKNIEVQRAESYIQWRYEGDEWQNLVAIADIEGPAGQNGTDGANGKTPEFRVSENILQWRYVGDEIWLNLYDLTALKGADGRDGVDGKDGTNGQNGRDGKDGKTPFIGENGNWWIGDIDTGVKAAGTDGKDGVDGDKGEKVTPAKKVTRAIKATRVTKAIRATPVRTVEASGTLQKRAVPSTQLGDTASVHCQKSITAEIYLVQRIKNNHPVKRSHIQCGVSGTVMHQH